MAKGYWVAHVDVTDPEAYKAYMAANAAAFKKFRAIPRARRRRLDNGRQLASAHHGHRI